MSRLDDHIAAVRNRLALAAFIRSISQTTFILAFAILLGVLLDRLFLLHPPAPIYWIYAGIFLALLIAIFIAIKKRPPATAAAIAIDEKLNLRERLSTALAVREGDDPFAQAAVVDAEKFAESLSLELRRYFPFQFPRAIVGTVILLLIALACYAWIDPLSLFNRREKIALQHQQQIKIDTAKENVKKELADVSAMQKTQTTQEAINKAKIELQAVLDKPIADPSMANRTAVKTLQELNDTLRKQAQDSNRFAQVESMSKLLRSMQSPNEKGAVADAQKALAKNDFNGAAESLAQAAQEFSKMDAAQQQQATEQMENLAKQLAEAANDPKRQEAIKQQLQHMGANSQQLQQAQNLLDRTAKGDAQAQQQLQQLSQQLAGQNATPEQLQEMQKLMQQLQAMAAAKQNAQQLSKAAQQAAQAMKNASQNPSQNPAQSPPQSVADTINQMKQQLAQMQNGSQPQPDPNGQSKNSQANAQPSNGNNPNEGGNSQSNTPGGPGAGHSPGQHPVITAQQMNTNPQPVLSPSQIDPQGQVLAGAFVKDNQPLTGKSTQSLHDVVQAAQQDPTDEVDQERVGRPAQKAVRDYFGSLEK